jgi:hypothetical protein
VSHARPYTKIARFGTFVVTDEPEIIVGEMVDYHLYGDPDEEPPVFTTVFMSDDEFAMLTEFDGW